MTKRSTNGVVHHLHRAAKLLDVAGLTDGELLDHYVRDRDESAFAGLVHRHGPMVWGVCRRILGPSADAEDAFQATFLVLVRKAPSVSPPSRVGNWLYGVAHHTALKASAMNRKRRGKEAMHRRPEPAADRDESLTALLDGELRKLPEKYRSPIICCELQGRTIKEAARHLGWAEGTVAGRLARGREMLAKRLKTRDVTLPAGAIAAALTGGTAAAEVPRPLFESTIQSAAAFAEGATATLPVKVVALTEGVIRAMLLTKLKVLTAAVAGVAVLATAAVYAPAAFPGGTPQKPILKPAEKTSVRLEWKERFAIQVPRRGDQFLSASISPDGKRLAIASNMNTRIYDPTTGKEVVTVESDLTFTAVFSPDNKTLATGHARSVKLWDAVTGAYHTTLDGNTKNIAGLAFSPDGKFLAAAEGNGIRLWDMATHKERKQLQAGDEKTVLYSVAFSPDGKRMISADGSAKTATIWDVETGKVRKTFPHKSGVVCAAFAPDAKSLATVEGDGLINWWFVDEDRIQSNVNAKAAGRTGLAFSPDGSLLAFADTGDQTVKLWDLAAFKEHRTLEHGGPVRSVAFSADGLTIVTAGDNAVRVWEPKK